MEIQKSEGATTVWHGAYGEWTYYDIVQHSYGSTDCEADHQEYVELLEIKNAPPWRSKYVIHEYWNAHGSTVYEFISLGVATAAYEKWSWTFNQFNHEVSGEHSSPDILRSLFYGQTRPWFYVELKESWVP